MATSLFKNGENAAWKAEVLFFNSLLSQVALMQGRMVPI
jgi:hypothetical protein